jgi:hypothetical protein
VIVEGIVQGFGKITGDFGLGLLIPFDRFASVEPSISNVVEVTGEPAGTTRCRLCQRAHIGSTSAQIGPLPSASGVVRATKRRRTSRAR